MAPVEIIKGQILMSPKKLNFDYTHLANYEKNYVNRK